MMKKKSLWFFVKQFRRNSVFVRNLLLFFVVLMIPMLIFSYYFSDQTTKLLREQNAATSVSTLERIADGFKNQLAEAEYMIARTGFNDNVHRFVLAEKPETEKYEVQIAEYLGSYVSVSKHIDSMYVYSFKSEMVMDNHSLYEASDFQDNSWIRHTEGLGINDTRFVGRKKDGGYLNCITVIKPIYITPEFMNGAVAVNLSIKAMSKNFDDIAGVENIYIVQSNGNTVYCKDGKQINQLAPEEIMDIVTTNEGRILEGKGYNIFSEEQYVSMVPVENYGMYILSLTPKTYYSEKVQNVRNNMLLIFTILVFIALVGAAFMALRSFIPIKSIYEIVSDDDTNADIAYMNEFLLIENKIKKSLAKNEEMNRELQMRIESLREAQLTALQAQINPHFLYNTLDNLNWLAFKRIGGKNEVSDGLLALSQLFRESTRDECYVVTMAEEVKLTQLYLNIIDIRYKDVVKTEFNISPELYQTPIVKISLQPLIENAIQHGIKPKGEGTIKITGRRVKDDMEIIIDDDGVGMSEDEIEELNFALVEDYVNFNGRIGLRNTNKRIKLVFGEEYGIKVSRNADGGLRTIVLLPKS